MTNTAKYQTRCVSCGRFMTGGEIGASWAQSWSYDMSGFPALHDPRFQCPPCTETHGPLDTNCGHPERYSGVIRQQATGADHA